MGYSDDLLEQAEHLAARETVGKPRQASLRRSISAAYYALFHQLTWDGAVLFTPTAPAGLRPMVKRVFDHGRMRDVCKKVNSGNGLAPPMMALLGSPTPFSAELRQVSNTFVLLQEARHLADYDLSRNVSRATTGELLTEAQNALSLWRNLSGTDEVKVFLAAMLYDRLGRNA